MRISVVVAVLMVACAACSSSTPAANGGAEDASSDVAAPWLDGGGSTDGSAEAGPSKWEQCATAFGSAIPSGFSRVDGTVLAIVSPDVTTCAKPNDDHVVLQVLMGGAAHRLVINVRSTLAGSDPRILFRTVAAPLPDPPWADGAHAPVTFDYVENLGLHSGGDFTPFEMLDVSRRIESIVPLGAKVAVYAHSSGGDSAHKIHRNKDRTDGAIAILGADGREPATWLLFHFANQSF